MNEFKRLHSISKMKNLATHGSHYTLRKKDCKKRPGILNSSCS